MQIYIFLNIFTLKNIYTSHLTLEKIDRKVLRKIGGATNNRLWIKKPVRETITDKIRKR